VNDHPMRPGAVHLVRLERGDDVYDTLSAFVVDRGIRAASVSALGAVTRASLRYYDQAARRYEDFLIDEPLEVVSAVGNVSLLDGSPFLHLHAALSAADGRAFGGHVRTGTVAFALEATIAVLEGEPPVRRPDAATGLTLWAPPEGGIAT
jgi:uncharacterized protein